MASSTIINIPTDDKVFESNCIQLFAGLLNDPNVKFVGTRGKKQFGLDLIGKRDRDPGQPVGIQCKLVTRGAKLTETTIRKEVDQAMSIEPALTEFYIVTTATDEAAYDFLATKLAQEQAKLGRTVDIQVWGWDTLQEKIRNDPKALAAFDPDYSASTNRLLELGSETLSGQAEIRAQNDQTLQYLAEIRTTIAIGPIDTARSAFDQHLDAQIDQYRDMLNAGRPRTALELLQALDSTLNEKNAVSIRARVKVNIAIARMKLGDEIDAAPLLDEAYALNPTDPRSRANRILSLTIQGDLAGAWTFAEDTLAEDASNVGAAGLAFQVAAMDSVERDPMAIVSPDLLDDHNVRIHRINYLRQKGTPGSWWTLAAETLERFPQDGNSIRMAGDALVDEALSGDVVERLGRVPVDRRIKLREGSELLQRHWDEVRHFEHAAEPDWCMVGYNLVTAYRALGDLEQAKRIADQVLATGTKDPDAALAAAWVAIDLEEFAEAKRLLRSALLPDNAVLPLLVALSNLHEWAEVVKEATNERRERLPIPARQLFDVLVFRARHAGKMGANLDEDVEQLLERWPLGVGAHIAVADIYRIARPEALGAMAEKTRSLITPATSYSDRVMFAQLSLLREAWEDIIGVLDGFVGVDRPSEPLAWLAHAFANAPTQARTSPFYQSLAPQVIALPLYARLAGAAEYNRGDLGTAEHYLRSAISAMPSDLRAILLLSRTLVRANKEDEARDLVAGINDDTADGSPNDLMRLAYWHRRAGETMRALRLAYRVAATNRHDENIVSSYPSIILMNEALPSPIGRAGPAQTDFWFDLEGLDGARDVTGIIGDEEIVGIDRFALDHPLAVALMGKSVNEVIEIPAKIGVSKRYRIKELKHKYIWLLHDIMAKHAAQFPDARSLFEMSIKDGDIQPILDVVRSLQDKDGVVAAIYTSHPIPLAAIAASSNRSVLQLAEYLTRTGTNLRTCIGATDEYKEATMFVRQARGKGVALDTLTLWQLHELGHLQAAKDYFGRLCIARSTMDEMIELRAKIESNRGREFMTMSFDGEQACRQVHSPEETEKRLEWVNAIIKDLHDLCDILPVDGSLDVRLDKLLDNFGSKEIFDPINLARTADVIILSEDLNLRQYAASQGVKGGAWLQVVLNVFAKDGQITRDQYLVGVGMLGAMRHGHLSLDAQTLLQMLALEDPRAFALFNAAIQFIGGLNAHMPSHIAISVDTMRGVWRLNLPSWQQSRAISRLLAQLVRSRSDDWKAVLHIIDAELAKYARAGDHLAQRARDYLADWIKGHFYDLAEIRSKERAIASVKPRRRTKRTKVSRPKKVGRG
ncbi:PIN domain-containing protein [Acetobacter oryzoeni]|uniref:Tetratricopeptide repeat protein n=1 Tax=Acetobacter oryzoeni TaxID=2500548 RepID=A0A5B9GRD9_9PROT|nr:tetratricopeptide repeat protein [Acetobacter oryzoeni]MCP1203725.1 tetratricopeptide repeat protein [Acetobacter oryzoeni]QEE86920.1 tetratricopeptide repeat protein [Acetobacter oryzoeni]